MMALLNEVNVVSVVIPVYNREDWLGFAIDSVLDQDCGFEHLQLVVVDDGSTDRSGQICDDYALRFPDQVVVVHQENAGVASALNAGVAAATGEIIGFLGSDDYLSSNTLSKVRSFFRSNWDVVDLACIKIEMTGSRSGEHWNHKGRFRRTRTVDVQKEWKLSQPHGGGTFIKRDVFAEWGLRFDPKLFMTEDATLNTQVILRKMAYGLIAGPTYYNRRYPEGGESLVASSHYRPEFYDLIVEHAYQRMFDDAKALYGYVPNYVQAMAGYDLVFRFRADTSMLGPAQLDAYRDRLQALLRQMSVKVIIGLKAPIEQRLNMLDLREGGRLIESLVEHDGVYSLHGVRVYGLNKRKSLAHRLPHCTVHGFEVSQNSLRIAATVSTVTVDSNWNYFLVVDGEEHQLSPLPSFTRGAVYISNNILRAPAFRAEVPFRANSRMFVELRVGADATSVTKYRLPLVMAPTSGFAGNPDVGYFRRDGLDVFRQISRSGIRRTRMNSTLQVLKAEAGFIKRARKGGAPDAALRLRTRLLVSRRSNSKNIWLLCDHKMEAGDNAEALFRYLNSKPELGIHPVLVLSADSEAYEELSAVGDVVEPGSYEFLACYASASVTLNSSADEYMLNPYGKYASWIRDLRPKLSVFLQHGVTKDDQSSWLNWTKKGFDVFVTSAARERESILDGPYAYEESQVALVGMPRYDRLIDASERLIVIAPTWRKFLSGQLDPSTGRVLPNEEFALSDYFSVWQSVLADERLNSALEHHGFRVSFAMHPSHQAESSKFVPGRRVTIESFPYDYRELFRRGALLVTDYSSVAFDFAYLRKPVVYLQPDRDEFFGGHLYKPGYYDYDQDGFGPVAFSVPELVDQLIELVSLDAEMQPEYRSRVDDFFAFEGGGNSQRLVEFVQHRQSELGMN